MSDDNLVIKLLQQVREQIASLEQNFSARFERLETRMDKLETRMDKLETKVDHLAGAIVTIVSMMGRMNDDIAVLKAGAH